MLQNSFKDGITLKRFNHPKFSINASKLISRFKTKPRNRKLTQN